MYSSYWFRSTFVTSHIERIYKESMVQAVVCFYSCLTWPCTKDCCDQCEALNIFTHSWEGKGRGCIYEYKLWIVLICGTHEAWRSEARLLVILERRAVCFPLQTCVRRSKRTACIGVTWQHSVTANINLNLAVVVEQQEPDRKAVIFSAQI